MEECLLCACEWMGGCRYARKGGKGGTRGGRGVVDRSLCTITNVNKNRFVRLAQMKAVNLF